MLVLGLRAQSGLVLGFRASSALALGFTAYAGLALGFRAFCSLALGFRAYSGRPPNEPKVLRLKRKVRYFHNVMGSNGRIFDTGVRSSTSEMLEP